MEIPERDYQAFRARAKYLKVGAKDVRHVLELHRGRRRTRAPEAKRAAALGETPAE